ncbi:MAG: hypothetical protein QM809_04635 [Gordonia sp. (in: high G+C Gram-positive bacteria)]|uniref:hypothetical protein n=1 Tax=Gordonia sp. (in: high G+C Gram-positive bacteria) TaxID=84139 RepID=UPI0039E49C0D
MEPAAAIGHFAAARHACLDVDPRRSADCLVAMAACALAAGDPERAASYYALAAVEYDALGAAAPWIKARTDYATVVVQLGDFAMAEEAVHEVLAAARDVAVDRAVLIEARLTLANLKGFSGRRAEAERELIALRESVPADPLWNALCEESLGALYADGGEYEKARPAYEGALASYQRIGHELRILEAQAGLGWVLIGCGEQERGAGVLKATRQRFTELRRADRAAACDYNLANFYALTGRFEEADAAFAAAVRGLSGAGMHHQIANLQWNRVPRLVRESEERPDRAPALRHAALDTAISALIATDYERFQFTDVTRRVQWMRHLAHRMRKTFTYAHRHGSPQLVADLIESALNAGVYVVEAELDDDHAEPVPMDRGPAPRPGPPGSGDGGGAALMMGATPVLSTSVLPLIPPPVLVDGTGRVVLAEQRARAAELDPEIRAVMAEAPSVTIW